MNQAPARNLLLPAAGFATWGVGFAAIYGLQAVGCAAGWNDLMAGPLSLQRVLLIVLLLAVTAAAVLTFRWIARLPEPVEKPQQFLHQLARYASMVAIATILFTFSSVFALSVC